MPRFDLSLPHVAAMAVLLGGLAGFAAPAMAGAEVGSTFDVDIGGFNSTGTIGYYVVPALQVDFGTTQVFTGVGINGQTITVSSSESVGATTTTDTIIISTPTNFLTTSEIDGTTISALQFDLGNSNAGGAGVALSSAILSVSVTGFTTYGTNSTLALTPTNASTAFSLVASEGVDAGTDPIDEFEIHGFELVFTYANPVSVPEPVSLAVFAAGLLGLTAVAQRRRLTR